MAESTGETELIARDQPTCFPEELIVGVSSRSDGTMLDRTLANRHDESVVSERRKFTAQVGIDYESCVYQIIQYGERETYDLIGEVTRPDTAGIHADALYTETSGVGLFLPVADCVATVIYDTKRRALALAHLGRHASIAELMVKLLKFMQYKGSEMTNIVIWMAPSVGKDSYKMEYFDYLNDPDWQGFCDVRPHGIYLDLAGFNRNLAIKLGVSEANIYASSVDTAITDDYFSHSSGDTSGRFAVVAQIK